MNSKTLWKQTGTYNGNQMNGRVGESLNAFPELTEKGLFICVIHSNKLIFFIIFYGHSEQKVSDLIPGTNLSTQIDKLSIFKGTQTLSIKLQKLLCFIL